MFLKNAPQVVSGEGSIHNFKFMLLNGLLTVCQRLKRSAFTKECAHIERINWGWNGEKKEGKRRENL